MFTLEYITITNAVQIQLFYFMLHIHISEYYRIIISNNLISCLYIKTKQKAIKYCKIIVKTLNQSIQNKNKGVCFENCIIIRSSFLVKFNITSQIVAKRKDRQTFH